MKVDMASVVNKNRVTSGFEFQSMLVGSLCISGPCTIQLSFVTLSRIYVYQYAWYGCFCSLITLLTPCVTFFGYQAHDHFHWNH